VDEERDILRWLHLMLEREKQKHNKSKPLSSLSELQPFTTALDQLAEVATSTPDSYLTDTDLND